MRRLAALAAVAPVLVVAAPAHAFTCPATPLQQRIEEADAVFVGRAESSRPVAGDGVPQRVYTFTVDQEVKGDLAGAVDVRIPVRAANGGQPVALDVAAGLLVNRVPGGWYTTRCGITDPGAVLATVDKPKGNAVKLAIGLLLLAAVLAYSIRRVRRKQAAAGPGSLAP